MGNVYRGSTPKGFSGFKRLGIQQVRLPSQIEGFARQIEDERPERIRLAKVHLGLRRTYPVITLPESIIYDYLNRKKIDFVYQAVTYVGSTPDFFLIPVGVAVLVNGIYFHTLAGARKEDRRELQNLPGTLTDGMLIRDAVQIWEDQCLSSYREYYFDKMVEGVSIRSQYERG